MHSGGTSQHHGKNRRELLDDRILCSVVSSLSGSDLQPEWGSFALWGEDLEINVAKVEVIKQPGLSGWFIITALPTICHCKDGEFRHYLGSRNKKHFINYKWESVEKYWTHFIVVWSRFCQQNVSTTQLSVWIRTITILLRTLDYKSGDNIQFLFLAILLSGPLLGLCMIFVLHCLFLSQRYRSSHTLPNRILSESSQPLIKEEE